MDGPALRDARKRLQLRLKDVAQQLGVSSPYLSHIEGGRKPLPSELASAYTKLVKSGKTLGNAALSGRVINQFRSFTPYLKHTWRNATRLQLDSGTLVGRRARIDPQATSPRDLGTLLAKMMDGTPSPPPKAHTTLVWHRPTSYDGTIIGDHYENIVQRCVDYDVHFSHFVVPDANDVGENLLWLLNKTLTYVHFRNYVHFDTVKALDFGMFGIDFFVVADDLACMRFAGLSSDDQKSGMIISEREQVAPLRDYVRRIENNRDYAISLYLGEHDLARFFDAYAMVGYKAGPKLLLQQFLGSFTQPADYLRPDSSWWNRYQLLSKKISNFDIELIAVSRLRSLAELRSRLSHSPVKQICSIETLQVWAKTGVRPDIETRRVVEQPEERRARIDHVLYLLRQFSLFEIGLLPDAAGKHLGWEPVFDRDLSFTKARSTSWLTQGYTTVLESTVPTDIKSSGEINYTVDTFSTLEGVSEFQCIIDNSHLAQDFSALFDQTWRTIPARQRGKADVIAFFETLRRSVA